MSVSPANTKQRQIDGDRPEFIQSADFEAIPADETFSPSSTAAPLVSVLMLAWNHAPYIRQSIESIVCQQCDFDFELIIGEDQSSDDTLAICRSFQREFPSMVRLVTSSDNVGMHRNFARIWHKARGEFIAFCEGDDFWTDPEKLRRQVEWMKCNPTYTLCGSPTNIIRENTRDEWEVSGTIVPPIIKQSYSLKDLIPFYSFHTSSIILRKSKVGFPTWLWQQYCIDRPLYLLCAEQGPVGYLPDVMSVYRLHGDGNWSPISWLEKAQKGINLFNALDRHFSNKYHSLFQLTIAQVVWSYMNEAIQAGKIIEARKLYWMALSHKIHIRDSRAILSTLLRLYVPSDQLLRFIRTKRAEAPKARNTERP